LTTKIYRDVSSRNREGKPIDQYQLAPDSHFSERKSVCMRER
jgi:hypothetical protein